MLLRHLAAGENQLLPDLFPAGLAGVSISIRWREILTRVFPAPYLVSSDWSGQCPKTEPRQLPLPTLTR